MRSPGDASSARVPFSPSRREGPWLCAALLLLVLGGLGYAAAQALWSPSVAFLVERPSARWIVPDLVPSPHVRSGQFVEAPAVFRREFELDGSVPGKARLRLRAFRRFELRVNGRVAARSRRGASWKVATTVPVADLLRPGANEIRVRVSSSWGPPALWLAAEEVPGAPPTDSSWSVSFAGEPESTARIADDTRPLPINFQGPEPWESLREHAVVLLAVFLLALTGFGALGSSAPVSRLPRPLGALREHPSEIVLAVAVVAWGAMAAHNLPQMSPRVGFDAPSHIAYAEHLLEERALPQTDRAMYTAPDGGLVPRWESHQPPLFYALSAAVLALGRAAAGPEAALGWLRALPLLSGLGLVLLTWATARILFPRSGPARAAAVGLVAFAPMNVYVAHYVSNESLSALCMGGALALGVRLGAQERPGPWGFAALGAVSGLALMTKATFATTFPWVLAVLAFKLLVRDGFGPGAVAARLGAALALAVPLGGWFWVRSWILFGTPLVLPWEGGMGFDWWQDPGFHTADWFLSFGSVFAHPLFVGSRSFLDSLYATFWGDAFVGGMPGFGHPGQPPWHYTWMVAIYPLALPATILVGAGAIDAIRRVARAGSAPWTLLLAATVVAGLSLLLMNLRIPYYAQAKSFYALGALLPVGLLGGAGFGWLDERLRVRGGPWAVAPLRAYAVLLALTVIVGFWARQSM